MKIAFSLTQPREQQQWLLRTNYYFDGASNVRVQEHEFESAEEATAEILRVVEENHVPAPAPLPAESPAVVINPKQGQESPVPVTINEAKQ